MWHTHGCRQGLCIVNQGHAKKYTLSSFLWHVYPDLYVQEIAIRLLKMYFRLSVLKQSPGDVDICVYQVHSYDLALCLVCSSAFPSLFSGHFMVKRLYVRDWDHTHLCGHLSPTEVHSTLVKAQYQVTKLSSG